MSVPIHAKLYERVKKKASKVFQAKTGVYRSAWIVREYKKLGGRFEGEKPNEKVGLLRWFKEKWVNLKAPGKRGYEACGRKRQGQGARGYPLCRPSVRVTKDTPKTYKEVDKGVLAKNMKIKSGKTRVYFSGGGGGGREQFHGRKSDVMMMLVPRRVARCAEWGFELREAGFRGGKETGWKRAKQLSTQAEISIEDVRYMRNWYARHMYTSYPGYRDWVRAGKPMTADWQKKHSIISWVIWGGDAGFEWVNSKKVIALLNKTFGKSYADMRK